MPFEVLTTESYELAFDRALQYGLENYGKKSARNLLALQGKTERRLSVFPYLGCPVDVSAEDNAGDVYRWVKLGFLVAVYRTDGATRRVYLQDLFHPSSAWREKYAKSICRRGACGGAGAPREQRRVGPDGVD